MPVQEAFCGILDFLLDFRLRMPICWSNRINNNNVHSSTKSRSGRLHEGMDMEVLNPFYVYTFSNWSIDLHRNNCHLHI